MSAFWRLIPAVALTAALGLLLAGLGIAVYADRTYHAQKISEVGVQAQILASGVAAALVFDDPTAAREYVGALKANPELRVAAVYDATGALFASYVRAGSPPPPPEAEVGKPYFDGNDLILARTVTQEGSRLGTVYLRTVTEPVSRRLVRYGGIALLVTMGSLLVVVLAAAQATLNRANDELKRRAQALAETNRSLHAEIEERERAEEALRQSQKMEAIGQLSGGIAHDFNNLLTIISGNLEMLRKRLAAGRTDVGRYIDMALEGAARAGGLTQQILAFSRRQPLSPQPVQLSRLVAGMDALLRHSVHEDIAVETRLDARWLALCDPNQMENVILNLAINARDAMPGGGRLVIETADIPAGGPRPPGAPEGDHVRLTVVDSGAGMTEEVRRRAIDPFFTTKPQGQGTGLGLSMVFGYVKQSNGHLQIDSAPGAGTIVTILMPRHQAEAGAATGPAAEGDASGSPSGPPLPVDRPVVLIVEDEDDVRTLAVETVRDEGYAVVEEADGDAALTVLESDIRIDMLVTDVRLPGANGYRLAETGLARRPGMKILLMTGFAQDPPPAPLVRAGVPVLHKPFAFEKLAAAVNAMLRNGRT